MLARRPWLGFLASLAATGCLADIRGPQPIGDPTGNDGRGDGDPEGREDPPADDAADPNGSEAPEDLGACPQDYCLADDGFCDEALQCLDARNDAATCERDTDCDEPTTADAPAEESSCAPGALGMACDGNDECDSRTCAVTFTVQDGHTTQDGRCSPASQEPCFDDTECGAGLECFDLYAFAGLCMSASEREELCTCGSGDIVESCP